MLERIQPDGLRRPPTYAPVVRTTGGSTVYISGQVPVDVDGNPVGVGDFEAQARQVFSNLRLALASVGADFSNVAKVTTYIVNYSPALLDSYSALRAEAMGDALPASTLVGVLSLARPDFLIEIEAIAIV